MITHELQLVWRGGGNTLSKVIALQAEGEDNRDVDVPNPSTNLLVDFEVDVSQLKLIYLVSNKALTIKTNDSGSPQETLTLVADKPLLWFLGSGLAIPFAGDVSAFYVSNSSGAAAELQIKMLFDATP